MKVILSLLQDRQTAPAVATAGLKCGVAPDFCRRIPTRGNNSSLHQFTFLGFMNFGEPVHG